MRTFRAFLALLLLIPFHSASGSGFSIWEQGAKATAMGGAFAATADDPSAIFFNVAGLAQQRQMAVLAGGTIINFSNEFRGDPDDAFTSGQTAFYDRHTFVPPNAYLVVPVGDNVTFGIGQFTAFGLRTDWQDPFIGRFISRDVDLKTASIEPAVAWQTSDGRWAVGAGIEYRRARVTLQRNQALLNPFTRRFADAANVYLSSDWTSGWGWSAGVLVKPNATWRIGASYRADMDLEIEGDATFTQIPIDPRLDPLLRAGLPPNQAIRSTVPFPATAAIGIATSAIPNWDIEFDLTHTTWSRFETLLVEFARTPAANLHTPQNWEDTRAYRFGANRRLDEAWDIRFGAVYDENPQPVESVGPLLPDSDRIGVMFGLGFRHGPWVIDVTELILHFRDRSTEGRNADNFNGTYETNANLLSLNLGYRF